jgi:hypothetical protein
VEIKSPPITVSNIATIHFALILKKMRNLYGLWGRK